MNNLRDLFEKNSGRLIHKWLHYFDVYETYFQKYKNQPVVILEIGVSQGGSLKIWKEYFGEKALIIGVDIDEACKGLEDEQTRIFIGDQEDRTFLKTLKQEIPKVDILIDDGGHTMAQQIVTFEELYEHVKEDGVYLCEDIHTSYWPLFGGGYRRQGTFIEYSKCFVDQIHAWHYGEQVDVKEKNFLKTSAFAVHFYDSILVIEKKKIDPPQHKATGQDASATTSNEKYDWNSSDYYGENGYVKELERLNDSFSFAIKEKDKYINGLESLCQTYKRMYEELQRASQGKGGRNGK